MVIYTLNRIGNAVFRKRNFRTPNKTKKSNIFYERFKNETTNQKTKSSVFV